MRNLPLNFSIYEKELDGFQCSEQLYFLRINITRFLNNSVQRRTTMWLYNNPRCLCDYYASLNIMIICLCDVTVSVYPHRAGLKNMHDHGGIRTYDLCRPSKGRRFKSHRGHAGIFFKPAWCVYTLRVTSQPSYSPEYITPTQQISKW